MRRIKAGRLGGLDAGRHKGVEAGKAGGLEATVEPLPQANSPASMAICIKNPVPGNQHQIF
jgi:hypothetical protein